MPFIKNGDVEPIETFEEKTHCVKCGAVIKKSNGNSQLCAICIKKENNTEDN